MEIIRPDNFECPITHELMRFPQRVESCGHVFERNWIRARFLDQPNRCPQCHDKQVSMNLVPARDRYREIKQYVLYLFRTQSAEISDPEVEQFLIAHPKFLEKREVVDYFCNPERAWKWLQLEKTAEREDTALIEQVRQLMGRTPAAIFNDRRLQAELTLYYTHREEFETALKRRYQREGVEQYRAAAKTDKLLLEDLFFRMRVYRPPEPVAPAPAPAAAAEPGFQLIRPILIDNVRRMARDWWSHVVPVALGPQGGLAVSLGISLAVLIGNVVAACVAGGFEAVALTTYLLMFGELFLTLYWFCFIFAIMFFFGQMVFAGAFAGMNQPAFLGMN